MLSLQNHLFYSIKHSIEQKILLKLIGKGSFETLKSFHTLKKWTLGFCQILKGSYSKTNWQNNELMHYLLARLEHYKLKITECVS